jgi:hypothetical protein
MRLKPGRLPLFCLLLICAQGCAARFESFRFLPARGGDIVMRESPGTPKEREGTLIWDGAAETPLYTLKKPALVSEAGQSFVLSYKSARDDCALTVYSSKDAVQARADLPKTGQYVYRFLLPLPKSSTIWGFRVASGASTPPAEDSFSFLGAGTTPRTTGLSIAGGEVSTDGSVELLASRAGRLSFGIPQSTRTEMAGKLWGIDIELQPPIYQVSGATEPTTLSVSFSGGASRAKSYSVSVDAGLGSLYIPEGSLGFIPRGVDVARGETAEGDLSSGMPPSRGLSVFYIEDNRPIPAELGAVLEYPRADWRRSDFEVFSWSRFPRVLVFDTADYDMQDDLFKRIAFFVEKPGYAGTIPDPGVLAGRHGWNAHDYRAEDLARFFETARRGGSGLTRGEAALLEVLRANGIVVGDNSGYSAGDGAVLSISKSSGAELRRKLLTHESFHGVFFSLSEYRDACARAWGALSGAEREMWLLYFGLSTYDTSNEYLMVNEFQAYLFQQPRDELGILRAAVVDKVLGKYPIKDSIARQFTTDSLRRSFDYLGRALGEAGGPPGGESIAMEETPHPAVPQPTP